MSGVRKNFCDVASSGAGGCSRPRKYGISGCMPALFSSVEWSQAGGTSEPDGWRLWPFDSKYERKPSRSSAVVRMRVIVRVALPARSRPPRVRFSLSTIASGRRPGEPSLEAVSRRRARAAARGSGSSLPISSRIFSSARRISRDTCICEIPTCCAICDWVSPSKNRRWRIIRSRSSSTRNPGARRPGPRRPRTACSSTPSDSSGSSSPSSSRPPPVESETEVYARPLSIASTTAPPPRARRLGQLGNRRGAAELDRQLLDQLRELDVQLLEPAGHAHRPALVAEVALDLADDVRRRVGRELDAAVEVEAVDRLDQPDGADLDEIVELLAAVRVATGERADERHVLLDQLLARREVSLLVVAAQQSRGLRRRSRAARLDGLRQRDPVAAFARRRARPGRRGCRGCGGARRLPRPPPRARRERRRAEGRSPSRSRRPSRCSAIVTSSARAPARGRASSASWRSSRCSIVRLRRMPSPLRTRCATL